MKKWALIFSASIAILLNGCVVIGGLVAGETTSILYDKRSIQTIYNDHNISLTVLKRISKNKTLSKNTNISINTFDGNVLLTGQAQTANLRQNIESIASSITGVRKIYDQIEIAAPSDRLESTNDGWLTTKARTKLLSDKGLGSLSVKIVSINSVVYLMGKCSRKQGEEIADIVRRVHGVNRVIKVFEYTDITA